MDFPELSSELCNYLAKLWHSSQVKNSRYHKFKEIHASDLSTCPIRLLLDRIYETTPMCRMLYYIQEGLEWEQKAIQSLQQMYPHGEKWRHLEKIERILDVDYKIVGTPDFIVESENSVVEIKWTRFNKKAIYEILRNKTIIGSKVFPNFEYYPIARRELLFDGWVKQIATYMYLLDKIYGRRYTGYLYLNRGHSIDLVKIEWRDIEKVLDFVEKHIKRLGAMLKYYIPKIYVPHHNIETVFWRELRDLYCKIWNNMEYYKMVEYQCRLCPYAWSGTCPGIIPLRKFYSKKIGPLWLPEEVERLRFIMGFSDTLQSYLRDNAPDLYDALLKYTKDDQITYSIMRAYNDTDFIAGMIDAVREDCQFAFRRRPPKTKTIKLE